MISTILIRDPIEPEELSLLFKEFPQYNIITLNQGEPLLQIGLEACGQIEIIYGCRLLPEELSLVPDLHWIHCSAPFLDLICMDAIRHQENILLTTTKEENLIQIGEFAISAALAFSKKLFDWELESRNPKHLDILDLRKKMWKISDKIFLQIGLGTIGTEIARRAKQEGFIVWGMQKLASFHPYCDRMLPLDELHEILPKVDIVCLAMPREQEGAAWFTKEEMDLMQDDSVLLVFGTGSAINLKDLADVGLTDKFRGILLDAHFSTPISRDYPLWEKPYVIVTHESGIYPITHEHQSFNTFLYNLRQYLHGNFSDMKNLIK